MKKYLILFPLFLLCFSCSKNEEFKEKDDFNSLMGANTTLWKFVETHEDRENLEFFKTLYETNKDNQFLQQTEISIPKVIHCIWVGPNPFPQESKENIASWIQEHPTWKFKFWSDRNRPLPHPKMELNLVSQFKFLEMGDYYQDSDNYAEKADVLRYEILYQEGGLYVDHDVKCFKSFDCFHHNYDFYCCMEPPHPPILSSSISVNNNVIGSRPHHPILMMCMDLVKNRWVDVGTAYPGNDKESIVCRVARRTFSPFDETLRQIGGKDGSRDIVLPAAYFNRLDNNFALFAHHYYAATWYEDETVFERNVRRRLISISRKNNQILLFNAVILSANLFLVGCLFFQFRSLRRWRKP